MKQLALGIVVRGDCALLVTSRKHDGKWIWPKGTVEPNETIENAVVREICEEAGVTARIRHRLEDFVPKEGQQGYAFVLDCVKELDEREWIESHERVRKWVPFADVHEMLDLHPYQREIWEAARAKLL